MSVSKQRFSNPDRWKKSPTNVHKNNFGDCFNTNFESFEQILETFSCGKPRKKDTQKKPKKKSYLCKNTDWNECVRKIKEKHFGQKIKNKVDKEPKNEKSLKSCSSGENRREMIKKQMQSLIDRREDNKLKKENRSEAINAYGVKKQSEKSLISDCFEPCSKKKLVVHFSSCDQSLCAQNEYDKTEGQNSQRCHQKSCLPEHCKFKFCPPTLFNTTFFEPEFFNSETCQPVFCDDSFCWETCCKKTKTFGTQTSKESLASKGLNTTNSITQVSTVAKECQTLNENHKSCQVRQKEQSQPQYDPPPLMCCEFPSLLTKIFPACMQQFQPTEQCCNICFTPFDNFCGQTCFELPCKPMWEAKSKENEPPKSGINSLLDEFEVVKIKIVDSESDFSIAKKCMKNEKCICFGRNGNNLMSSEKHKNSAIEIKEKFDQSSKFNLENGIEKNSTGREQSVDVINYELAKQFEPQTINESEKIHENQTKNEPKKKIKSSVVQKLIKKVIGFKKTFESKASHSKNLQVENNEPQKRNRHSIEVKLQKKRAFDIKLGSQKTNESKRISHDFFGISSNFEFKSGFFNESLVPKDNESIKKCKSDKEKYTENKQIKSQKYKKTKTIEYDKSCNHIVYKKNCKKNNKSKRLKKKYTSSENFPLGIMNDKTPFKEHCSKQVCHRNVNQGNNAKKDSMRNTKKKSSVKKISESSKCDLFKRLVSNNSNSVTVYRELNKEKLENNEFPMKKSKKRIELICKKKKKSENCCSSGGGAKEVEVHSCQYCYDCENTCACKDLCRLQCLDLETLRTYGKNKETTNFKNTRSKAPKNNFGMIRNNCMNCDQNNFWFCKQSNDFKNDEIKQKTSNLYKNINFEFEKKVGTGKENNCSSSKFTNSHISELQSLRHRKIEEERTKKFYQNDFEKRLHGTVDSIKASTSKHVSENNSLDRGKMSVTDDLSDQKPTVSTSNEKIIKTSSIQDQNSKTLAALSSKENAKKSKKKKCKKSTKKKLASSKTGSGKNSEKVTSQNPSSVKVKKQCKNLNNKNLKVASKTQNEFAKNQAIGNSSVGISFIKGDNNDEEKNDDVSEEIGNEEKIKQYLKSCGVVMKKIKKKKENLKKRCFFMNILKNIKKRKKRYKKTSWNLEMSMKPMKLLKQQPSEMISTPTNKKKLKKREKTKSFGIKSFFYKTLIRNARHDSSGNPNIKVSI